MAHVKKLVLLGIKQVAAFVAKKFKLQFKMQGRLEISSAVQEMATSN